MDGLRLFVVGNSRAWILRVAVGIRNKQPRENHFHRRDIGLGNCPEISLAEACDKARELRKQVKAALLA